MRTQVSNIMGKSLGPGSFAVRISVVRLFPSDPIAAPPTVDDDTYYRPNCDTLFLNCPHR